jgi:hypothetical protein
VLVVWGVLLLILGLRISLGIHLVASVPQGDDYRVLSLLQHWTDSGKIDWHLFWWRTNGHFFVIYYLINLLQFKLNGFWDPRLDFLTFAISHTLEAAAVMLAFRRLLPARDRGWLYAFIFFLFATPSAVTALAGTISTPIPA